jgi:hypothetical protein
VWLIDLFGLAPGDFRAVPAAVVGVLDTLDGVGIQEFRLQLKLADGVVSVLDTLDGVRIQEFPSRFARLFTMFFIEEAPVGVPQHAQGLGKMWTVRSSVFV